MSENELQPKLNITSNDIPNIPTDTPLPKITTNIVPAEQIVKHEHHTMPKQPELKIELSRGQKGSYGWTISYNGIDLDKIIEKIEEADARLRELFLEE